MVLNIKKFIKSMWIFLDETINVNYLKIIIITYKHFSILVYLNV